MVSLGAALGANLRFFLYNKIGKLKIAKDVTILIINTVSSFFLGLFLSALPKLSSVNFSYELVLFFLIGFLGSLSTFSTFIYDLFDLCMNFKFFRALNLLTISISCGIFALAFGFLLGNQ